MSSTDSSLRFMKRKTDTQLGLFNESRLWEGMPNTRYQGSKRKLLPHLYKTFSKIKFRSALDAFGGTGSVSYLLSRMGVDVTYNDILPANCEIARALIAPGPIQLKSNEIADLFVRDPHTSYKSYISDIFSGIYFLAEENEQLDIAAQNISNIKSATKRAEAYYFIFQSMLCKRPYNLFHRANLEMRTKDVARGFGNKTTWDRPFIDHINKFYLELSHARSFERAKKVSISNKSAFEIDGEWDLVYIDTPYAKNAGRQESNYFDFYHFLDAIKCYDAIPANIQNDLKHRPFYSYNKSWFPTQNIDDAFADLFRRFSRSTLVLSYRSDGYPTPERIEALLKEHYNCVENVVTAEYKYVLSTRKQQTQEIVIVATEPKALTIKPRHVVGA